MKTINDAAIECANIFLQGYRDSYPADENDFVDVFEAGVEFAQQFYPIERDKDGFTTEKQREDFYNNFPILLNGYYGLELINEMTVDLDTPSYGYTHWRPVNLK